VDQLKEGWDVTNLYTIVPLRAFNSRTLIEQAIGRGLRLPYGKRVGVPAVDRLTIVAHDKFQEIIDEANRGDSVLKIGLVVIGKDIPDKHSKPIEIYTNLEQKLIGAPASDGDLTRPEQKTLFNTELERKAAKAALDAIQHFERLRSSRDLESAEVQQQIAARVAEAIRPIQTALPTMEEPVDVKQVVAEVTRQFIEMSIDIPKIVIVPSDDATYGFRDFDLDCKNIRLQPVSKDILIQNLQSNERYKLQDSSAVAAERRLEDYLIRKLIDFDDISYDDHATLLYKLAGQMLAHLRSYLANEDDVFNVLVTHTRQLVDLIYAEMQQHYFETATSYEVKITKGFRTLRSTSVLAAADEDIRPFRRPVDEKRYIRGMVFGGFARCLCDRQKFDSDSERRFALVLENEKRDLKWFKPGRGIFAIHYRAGIDEGDYEPDFVVETASVNYLCEPKQKDNMNDPVVVAKAEAGRNRLRSFDAFCRDTSQQRANETAKVLVESAARVNPLQLLTAEHGEIEADLSAAATAEDRAVINAFVKQCDSMLTAVKSSLASRIWSSPGILPSSPDNMITAAATALDKRAQMEESVDDPVARAKLTSDRDELAAREWLATVKDDVLMQIGRHQQLAFLKTCQKDTTTRAITDKNTELTKLIVTDAFCKRFQDEVSGLGLKTISVKMEEIKGKKGETRFGLRLQGASDHKVHEIASEGEQRCVALAAFLAELSQASHQSALVFDDPVSSLDHRCHQKIADGWLQRRHRGRSSCLRIARVFSMNFRKQLLMRT
jgi:hypothetical protein